MSDGVGPSLARSESTCNVCVMQACSQRACLYSCVRVRGPQVGPGAFELAPLGVINFAGYGSEGEVSVYCRAEDAAGCVPEALPCPCGVLRYVDAERGACVWVWASWC